MKKTMHVMPYAIAALLAIALVGCGVPKSEHEKLRENYNKMQQEIASYNDRVEALQVENAFNKKEVERLNAENTALKGENQKLAKENETLKAEIVKQTEKAAVQ